MITVDTLLLAIVVLPALVVLLHPVFIACARKRWADAGRGGGSRDPSVSLAVPLARTEEHAAMNLRSYFGQGGFPEYQIVVVAEEESDPSVIAVREASVLYPGVDVHLAFSGSPGGRIAKMHNLRKALEYCRHEVVAFVDSDVVFRRNGDLKALTSPLCDGRAGMVTAAPVYRRPSTVGGYLLATMINADLWAYFALLFSSNRMNVANGAFIALRRQLLERIGALHDLQHQVLNDTAIARKVVGAGEKILLAGVPVSIRTPSLKLIDWWRQVLRWHVGMRSVLPLPQYLLYGVHRSPMATGLALFTVMGDSPLRWLFVVIPAVARVVSFSIIQACWLRELRALPELLLVVLTDLVSPFLWILSWRLHTVRWRDRHYRIGKGGVAEEVNSAQG